MDSLPALCIFAAASDFQKKRPVLGSKSPATPAAVLAPGWMTPASAAVATSVQRSHGMRLGSVLPHLPSCDDPVLLGVPWTGKEWKNDIATKETKKKATQFGTSVPFDSRFSYGPSPAVDLEIHTLQPAVKWSSAAISCGDTTAIWSDRMGLKD